MTLIIAKFQEHERQLLVEDDKELMKIEVTY